MVQYGCFGCLKASLPHGNVILYRYETVHSFGKFYLFLQKFQHPKRRLAFYFTTMVT